MTLDVIGAGFGRTGTHSLKNALEILGFGPCHHMYEVRQSEKQLKYWDRIADGEPADWGVVLDGFRSQVDWPGARFWASIYAANPQAKVILTTRDPMEWYRSILKTILPSATLGRLEDHDKSGRLGSDIIYRIVLQDLFQGRIADMHFAIDLFHAHAAEVRDTVPESNLLVYEVGSGWQPLCDFLGVAVPTTPFPSGNTIADFRSRKAYLHD